MTDKTKLRITPTLRAELEEKYGKGVSITVIDADGTRYPLKLDSADAPRGLNKVPEVNADDVKLIGIGDKKFVLHHMPPKHLCGAEHHKVGEMLHELQRHHDSGEMKCLAVVWTDEEGTSYPAVAGLLIGESLPVSLKNLAVSVIGDAGFSSEDDEPGTY